MTKIRSTDVERIRKGLERVYNNEYDFVVMTCLDRTDAKEIGSKLTPGERRFVVFKW